MDDMFYEHMSQFSAAQYQSQDGPSYHDSPQEMQTLLGGSPQQGVLAHSVPGVVDADTIAMWSNAPTGFE